VNEIPAPDLIPLPGCCFQWLTRLPTATLFPLRLDRYKAFRTTDPLHLLEADQPPFLAQQSRNKAVTVGRLFKAQRTDTTHQLSLTALLLNSTVSITRAAQPKVSTRPAQRTDSGFKDRRHRSPLVLRAYHFFEFTSSSTRMFKA